MRRWLIITTLLLYLPAARAELPPSQERAPGEDWRMAAQRALGDQLRRADTAYDRAVPLSELDRSKTAVFPLGTNDVATTFAEIRDRRFLEDPEIDGVSRRLTWLYPDDGCYQRAGWMSRMLNARFGAGWSSKLFAFGDLQVSTTQHPSGAVYWWYHVVTAMSVDGSIQVFDPSIEATRPLPLESWVARMSDHPNEVEVSLCRSGAYSPSSLCDRRVDVSEAQLREDAEEFLSLERTRLIRLGRDAERELGEHPPWSRQTQLVTQRISY